MTETVYHQDESQRNRINHRGSGAGVSLIGDRSDWQDHDCWKVVCETIAKRVGRSLDLSSKRSEILYSFSQTKAKYTMVWFRHHFSSPSTWRSLLRGSLLLLFRFELFVCVHRLQLLEALELAAHERPEQWHGVGDRECEWYLRVDDRGPTNLDGRWNQSDWSRQCGQSTESEKMESILVNVIAGCSRVDQTLKEGTLEERSMDPGGRENIPREDELRRQVSDGVVQSLVVGAEGAIPSMDKADGDLPSRDKRDDRLVTGHVEYQSRCTLCVGEESDRASRIGVGRFSIDCWKIACHVSREDARQRCWISHKQLVSYVIVNDVMSVTDTENAFAIDLRGSDVIPGESRVSNLCIKLIEAHTMRDLLSGFMTQRLSLARRLWLRMWSCSPGSRERFQIKERRVSVGDE